jgi:hypothetical protein
MAQVNVNPGTGSDQGGSSAGTTILGLSMVMFFGLAAFVILLAAVGWFVVRPMMMMPSGPSTINVSVPAQQAPAPAPAAKP